MSQTLLTAKLHENDERVDAADIHALYRRGVGRRRRRRVLLGVLAGTFLGCAVVAGSLLAMSRSDQSDKAETATVDSQQDGFEAVDVEAPAGSFVECLALTPPEGDREEACFPRFRLFLWHVGGVDFVLSAGPLPLQDGGTIEPDASGFAVEPYPEVAARLADPVMCITPDAVQGMTLELEDRTAAYSIPACAANAAVVVEIMADGEYATTASVLAGQSISGPLSVVSRYDTTVSDRTERCSPVADIVPPGATLTLRQLCLSLG